MAKIRFKCGCGKQLSVDEQFAGKTAKCPACNRPVQIPDPEAPKESAEPASNADVAAKMSTLTAAYGEAMLKQAQNRTVKAALKEYDRRVKRRKIIIASLILPALAVGFFGYKLLQTHGVSPGSSSSYPEAVRPFLSGCTSADVNARAAAAWEIADASQEMACSAQVANVAKSDESPFVRIIAIHSLMRQDPTQAIAVLKPLSMEDPDLDVQMTSAFGAAELEAKRSPEGIQYDTYLKAIIPILSDDPDYADHKDWIEDILVIAEKRCTSPESLIAARTKRENPVSRRIEAWVTAASLGPDSKMLELTRDPDPAVACSAIYALQCFLTLDAARRIEPKLEIAQRQLKTLTNALAQRIDDPPPVKDVAAAALAVSALPDQTYLFERPLGDPDWFVRFVALKGLSRMDPKAAKAIADAPLKKAPRENDWTRRVRERINERAQAASSGKADEPKATDR